MDELQQTPEFIERLHREFPMAASEFDELQEQPDDDERCDPWWVAELARGFVEVPAAVGVTGIMIPGELVTRSQEWFEEFTGVLRGRGFTRAVFSPSW